MIQEIIGHCCYSLLHLECHFFNLQSQSIILFSRSLLPRSVEKRPRRLRLEIEIKWHSKCNGLYKSLDIAHRTFAFTAYSLFSMERGKRDLESYIIDSDLRLKQWHSQCNRLYKSLDLAHRTFAFTNVSHWSFDIAFTNRFPLLSSKIV